MASISILLLEDDEAYTQVFKRSVESRGHDILCTKNKSEFLSALDVLGCEAVGDRPNGLHAVDLIVMDLKLEDGASLDLVSLARAGCPDAKIIMVTGYASIATTVEAIKRGADDYLPKPITIDIVLKAYEKLNSNSLVASSLVEESLSPKRLEWEHIQRVLNENDGNVTRTAKQLHIHRRTLQRKLQKKPVLK